MRRLLRGIHFPTLSGEKIQLFHQIYDHFLYRQLLQKAFFILYKMLPIFTRQETLITINLTQLYNFTRYSIQHFLSIIQVDSAENFAALPRNLYKGSINYYMHVSSKIQLKNLVLVAQNTKIQLKNFVLVAENTKIQLKNFVLFALLHLILFRFIACFYCF